MTEKEAAWKAYINSKDRNMNLYSKDERIRRKLAKHYQENEKLFLEL